MPQEVKTFTGTSVQTPIWWIQNVRLLNCVSYLYTFTKYLLRGCAFNITSLSITLPRNKGGLQLFLPYIARSSERHSLQRSFSVSQVSSSNKSNSVCTARRHNFETKSMWNLSKLWLPTQINVELQWVAKNRPFLDKINWLQNWCHSKTAVGYPLTLS